MKNHIYGQSLKQGLTFYILSKIIKKGYEQRITKYYIQDNIYKYKYYRNKMVVLEPQFSRDKHATISVILHRKSEFATIDNYLQNFEEQFEVEYIKPMYSTTEQTWEQVMLSTNAHINNRGKNIVLECLQFGGNVGSWDSFPNKSQIARYFQYCYSFAVDKIGYLHTDKNINCAVTVIEKNNAICLSTIYL